MYALALGTKENPEVQLLNIVADNKNKLFKESHSGSKEGSGTAWDDAVSLNP